MNNIRMVDEFLRLMADAIKNGYDIDKNTVYINLIYLDIGTDCIDISSNFDGWINRFRNNHDINVFIDLNKDYFCYFISLDYGNGYSF